MHARKWIWTVALERPLARADRQPPRTVEDYRGPGFTLSYPPIPTKIGVIGGVMDTIPVMDLDSVETINLAPRTENEAAPLVTLTSSVDDFEKIRRSLTSLRASNISAILQLKRPNEFLEDEELIAIFNFLREWDQMTLQNILELCEAWIPNTFLSPLQTEAKIELKWFREWLTASTDPRIHKYPSLPWRRFIRKIVSENYIFAVNFLHLVALPATDENIKAVQEHFNLFLESKKKVVSLFPKRWGKANEH